MWRLLEPLRAEEREAFLALAHRRTFTRNEVLCHEGDPRCAAALRDAADELLVRPPRRLEH